MSIATENFIKVIYKNQHQDGLDTKPGNIARKLGISNAAATDMAKKLATRDRFHFRFRFGRTSPGLLIRAALKG